jgi:hypothetical protein
VLVTLSTALIKAADSSELVLSVSCCTMALATEVLDTAIAACTRQQSFWVLAAVQRHLMLLSVTERATSSRGTPVNTHVRQRQAHVIGLGNLLGAE